MTTFAADLDFRQVERAIRDLPGKVPGRLAQEGLLAAGKVIQAQARTPNFRFQDQTGRLRRTIKTRRASGRTRGRKGRGQPYAEVVIGGPGARQGHLIEVGSVKAKARGPLRKAQEVTSTQQIAEAKRAMTKEFVEVGRELRSGNLRPATRRALVA